MYEIAMARVAISNLRAVQYCLEKGVIFCVTNKNIGVREMLTNLQQNTV